MPVRAPCERMEVGGGNVAMLLSFCHFAAEALD
jgi:hypothetical protein